MVGSPQPIASPSPTIAPPTPTATPSQPATPERIQLRVSATAPATRYAPITLNVEGSAGTRLGAVTDRTSGEGIEGRADFVQVDGIVIGTSGRVTISLPAPSGGWVSGARHYYQVYVNDPTKLGTHRGELTMPSWAEVAMDPRVSSVSGPVSANADVVFTVTGNQPHAYVNLGVWITADGPSLEARATADAKGRAVLRLRAPAGGWPAGTTQNYVVGSFCRAQEGNYCAEELHGTFTVPRWGAGGSTPGSSTPGTSTPGGSTATTPKTGSGGLAKTGF
ncbi:hypothetical protein GCM10028815_21250 [Mariniluteicoccus flavus]